MSESASASEKAFNAAERKVRAAKKERRSNAIALAVIGMVALYFFDIIGADGAVYFLIAGIDGITAGDPWLPAVKGSLGTIKMMGFSVCAGFAYYLARQEV